MSESTGFCQIPRITIPRRPSRGMVHMNYCSLVVLQRSPGRVAPV
jgi:hypothetical protein